MFFTRYCRSIHFTPGLAHQRFARGRSLKADINLVDLEDSVSPQDKVRARALAADFFPRERRGGPKLAIRINGLGDPHGLADLLAICEYPVKPDVVMIPKVESPRDVDIAARVLESAGAHPDLMAVVETARGIQNAAAIASASPRLKALVFGSADYSASINSTMDWDALYLARAQLVLAARAAGIHAVDTAVFDVHDAARLRQEAARARDLGFSGKAAIHPGQVPIINEVFAPDQAALEKARRIVLKAEESGGNICVVDGMMAGLPIVEAARQTLREFTPDRRALEAEDDGR